MSLRRLVAQAAARGRHVSPRLQAGVPAGRRACPRGRGRLAFAAVRPAFFAACMVEAVVAEASGGPAVAAVAAVAAPAAGRDGRLRGGCRLAGAAGETALPRRRRGGRASRPACRRCSGRRRQNGQTEHFSQVAARLRDGAMHSATITPRECGDARDLVLTTLSNQPCVQSSIFGFVAT